MLAADYTSFLIISPPLGYVIFAVAFVAGALVLFRFHRLFRSRLRASVGGDAGRLGIVERFTLGRQRELVVIRRDDAEHFVMIGRSTDIVIEPILDHPTRLEYAESDREWLQEQAEHAARRQRMRTYLDLTKRLY
jgi:Flagellar biosynthesis protein, FliO